MSALPQFPDTLIVQPDRIPAALKDGRKHVAWKWRMGDNDKPTKPPVNPDTGKLADCTAPSTWATFEDALARMHRDNLPGIFRALTSMDDLAGIDLDHCVNPDTGEIEPWALEIIALFMPCYAEFSPTGTGVRIFVYGRLDGAGCKTEKIEIYDQKRFLSMTGHPIPGAAETVEERQDALTALYRQLQADRMTTPAAALEFNPDFDAEGAAILEKVRPLAPGESPRRPTLTERIWKIAHGDDAVLKPTKDGVAPYEGESERRYAVVCALYDVGLNDDEVRSAFKATPRWQRCVADHGEKDAERRLVKQDLPAAKGFIGKQREEAAAKEREEHFAVDPETGEMLPLALPTIDAGNHDLPDITRLAWDALIATNDPPYLCQHGGVPSRLQYGEDERILLVPLTEHRLRCEVALAAEWYITRGKEQRVIAAEPPLSVIQNMLAGAELPLPVLRSISETPVFAPDGRLIDAAGFDAASGIYVQPVAGLIVPPVPDNPSAAEIANARNLIIDDLLGDFPFTEQADRAAAVALFLLPYVRAMIRGLTPMHGIESPTVGSGKGLLGDVLVRPAFGQHGGMIAEAGSDDEWRKRIGAKLREGAPIIQIDNVTRPLDSGALAMALTAPVFSDRILGQTATFRATVRNIWMFTANNPVLSLEIARRTVRIRIDTNEEKPWQRDTFKHKNLRAWVDTHRGDLIHAALTLVRGWIVAGKPMADVTLGSYEEWAATMGGILDVAGVTGFLDNMAAFYETADLEGAAWRQFVALWAEKYQSNKIGVADLFTLALDVDGFNFGKGGDRSQRVSFGSQLTKQRDRIYDGYRIALAGEVNRAKQWRLLPGKGAGYESRQQRFITVSADIATKEGEAMNLYESFSSPPAEKKMDDIPDDISMERESGKIHRDSYDDEKTLTGQGKTVMNLHLGDSPDGEPAPDAEEIAWEWIVAVKAEREFGMPNAVCVAAVRLGCALDRFAAAEDEAARLADYLDRHAAMKGGR